MMMMMMGKRLIANQFPLLKAMLPLALAFTVKSHTTFPNFCTQISAPSTTTPGRGVVTEFLINNCGLTPGDIAKAFRHNKDLLSQESCRNLKEVLELLKGCGLITHAQIRRVAKSAISLLQRLGVKGKELSELVAREPLLLSVSEEKVLESFKQAKDLGCQKESEIFARVMHINLGTGKEKIERRLQFLSSLGFSGKQVLELLRRWPLIVGLSEENVKHHVDFLVKSVELPLDYLVKHPALFGYSLEKRLIPRYRVMEALKSMQVLKTELICPSIFCCTERRFLEIYVNKNAESSILRDIYYSGKVNDTITGWTHKPDGPNPSLDDTISVWTHKPERPGKATSDAPAPAPWTRKSYGPNPNLDDTVSVWTRKPERPGKGTSDAPAPEVEGEEGPLHVCIEEGGIIHQVFAEGKLVGTCEGNPFKVLSGRDTIPVKFFHLIIGPVPKHTYNRCIILEKGRTLFPEASLIVAETSSQRTPGQTCYHVGIKLPHPPKKRLVYFQLYRAFPQLRQDQLQLDGRSGWRRLCNRIKREDPKYLSWKEETPKYGGGRKLNSFFKPPRWSRR